MPENGRQHVNVVEACPLPAVEAARKRVELTGAALTVDVIRSGWNASGSRYYPADILERDIPKVYPAGTQMFIDHPRASEREDQPERSLRTLAAVFTDTPWPVREADGQVVMRTNVRVFGDWREFLRERHKVIGVSINGGGEAEWAEREGRYGMVLEQLTTGQSVDFVTRPGAGGKIVALLESADTVGTVEAGTVGAWLESRIHAGFTALADDLYGEGHLTRAERISASSAIGDALAAYVRALEEKAPQLYQRDRFADCGTDQVALRESPAGRSPGGSTTASPATPSMKEPQPMPEITTAEALELAQHRVGDRARALVEEQLAESDLPPAAQVRIRTRFPVTALPLVEADRTLDEQQFALTIEAAIAEEQAYVAQILDGAGVGRVAGNGPAQGASTGAPVAFGGPAGTARPAVFGRPVATTEAHVGTNEALVQMFITNGLPEDAARRAAAGRQH